MSKRRYNKPPLSFNNQLVLLKDRGLAIEPSRLKDPKGDWLDKSFQNNSRVFYFLSVLKYLLPRANPSNSLKIKLEKLFDKYPEVPIRYLGVPSGNNGEMKDWKNQPIWKN